MEAEAIESDAPENAQDQQTPALAPVSISHRRKLVEFMMNPAMWIDESHREKLAAKIPEELVERFWRESELSPLLEKELGLPSFAGDQSSQLEKASCRLLISDETVLLEAMLMSGICLFSHSIVSMIDKRKLDAARKEFGDAAINFIRSKQADASLKEALDDCGKIPALTHKENDSKEQVIQFGVILLFQAAQDLSECWRSRAEYKIPAEHLPRDQDMDVWNLEPQQAECLLLSVCSRIIPNDI